MQLCKGLLLPRHTIKLYFCQPDRLKISKAIDLMRHTLRAAGQPKASTIHVLLPSHSKHWRRLVSHNAGEKFVAGAAHLWEPGKTAFGRQIYVFVRFWRLL